MRRGAMTFLAVLLGLAAAAGTAQGQDSTLVPVAEAARQAWADQDSRALLESASEGVRLQLPGADPSAPVSRAQGAALLRDYLRGAEEIETSVRAARVVGEGRGYVELARRFRVAGTEEERVESVLLGYRDSGSGWRLAELRVTSN